MRNRDAAYWLFLTPVLAALILVVIVPLIYGFYYSFTNWNGLGTPDFIGLKNYIDLFTDKGFLDTFWFTIKFSVAAIVVINIIGLSLALIVTSKIKSSNILRTVFFMPNLIGGLILGFIWQFIFIKVFGAIGDLTGSKHLMDGYQRQIQAFGD